MSEARQRLPRVFDLHDSAAAAQPGDYFWDFEASLTEKQGKQAAFEKLERLLQVLDDDAWVDLKQRAIRELSKRKPGRGWQSLSDVFNEAKGFAYLKALGARNVRFVPRTSGKTPDLQADLDGQRVLCEVKTINISDDEAAHRRRAYEEGVIEVTGVALWMTDQFLTKVTATLRSALNQLESFDPDSQARRIIFLVVNFNDWVGDRQREYIAQLDEHLEKQPSGAQIVVSSASNLFLRTFVMKNAAVWEPPA